MKKTTFLRKLAALIDEFEHANEGEYLNLAGLIASVGDEFYEYNGREMVKKNNVDYELRWVAREKRQI